MRVPGLLLSMVLWLAGAVAASQPVASDLDPVVEGLLAAWDSTDCVCLGEDHGDPNDSDLRIALVRHPDFARRVQWIVVEFANPVHQDVLDRFILDGELLGRDSLQVVWRDGNSPQTWEWPGYEAFLRAVRAVNLGLPRAERVRVVGGDAAIDWPRIETAADLVPFVYRGGEIRKTIIAQVLEPRRKALAIYGCGHCLKIGGGFPGELGASYPGRFWSACALPLDVGRAPSVRKKLGLGAGPGYVALRGTAASALDAQGLLPAAGAGPGTTIGELLDAVITYGGRSAKPLASAKPAYSPAFIAELERRARLTRSAFELWLERGRKSPR